MNKNTKAIFFDVDGTLVPFGSHSIPEEVKKCIRIAREKGIKIIFQPEGEKDNICIQFVN